MGTFTVTPHQLDLDVCVCQTESSSFRQIGQQLKSQLTLLSLQMPDYNQRLCVCVCVDDRELILPRCRVQRGEGHCIHYYYYGHKSEAAKVVEPDLC